MNFIGGEIAIDVCGKNISFTGSSNLNGKKISANNNVINNLAKGKVNKMSGFYKSKADIKSFFKQDKWCNLNIGQFGRQAAQAA